MLVALCVAYLQFPVVKGTCWVLRKVDSLFLDFYNRRWLVDTRKLLLSCILDLFPSNNTLKKYPCGIAVI